MEFLSYNLHASQLALGGHRQRDRKKAKWFSLSPSVGITTDELTERRVLRVCNAKKISDESADCPSVPSRQPIAHRRHFPSPIDSRPSMNLESDLCCLEEKFTKEDGNAEQLTEAVVESTGSLEDQLHPGDFRTELLFLALPASVGQAIDPLAQLAETASIGRLGI